VGLKAKTPEGLNLENAAIAHVVVLVEKRTKRAGKKAHQKMRKTRRR
jgi:hypothetical protein